MLATYERLKLLELTEELSKMILQSDLVENYIQCSYIVKQDKKAQQLIRQFIKLKEKYEEVHRFGRYHPDYLNVITTVREKKREMDLHDSIAAFKKAETDLQQLLDEVSVMVGHTVSKHIKVPTGNSFFDSQSGCSGGCSTGGSCGCS